jgi:hypothetical protein
MTRVGSADSDEADDLHEDIARLEARIEEVPKRPRNAGRSF